MIPIVMKDWLPKKRKKCFQRESGLRYIIRWGVIKWSLEIPRECILQYGYRALNVSVSLEILISGMECCIRCTRWRILIFLSCLFRDFPVGSFINLKWKMHRGRLHRWLILMPLWMRKKRTVPQECLILSDFTGRIWDGFLKDIEEMF